MGADFAEVVPIPLYPLFPFKLACFGFLVTKMSLHVTFVEYERPLP